MFWYICIFIMSYVGLGAVAILTMCSISGKQIFPKIETNTLEVWLYWPIALYSWFIIIREDRTRK